MEKCLYCYKPLKEGQKDFHPACARKMFGVKEVPALPYRRSEIADLAKQVVRAQTTLTGVQAKLSLDVNPGGKNEPDRFTIVGLWGRYILKPQTDAYRALPELEDLTMHMAEAAKIAVVPHSLIRFADGELCYITRRIDREHDGSKIAMEDMCQSRYCGRECSLSASCISTGIIRLISPLREPARKARYGLSGRPEERRNSSLEAFIAPEESIASTRGLPL